MDDQSVQSIIKATYWPRTMAPIALGALALFLVVLTLNELKSNQYIGSGVTATNTINVSGEGKVFAVPDTATFTVSVQEEGKDVATAQAAATKDGNAIIDYLKGAGIDQKDIQTTDYSVNPKYTYQQAVCPQPAIYNSGNIATPVYCPPGKQTLDGYTVSETFTVKVRDTSKAGGILSKVGTLGAFQVSGLSFTIDDETALEADARGKAIDDARTKAEALAKQLGVTLIRVVGFNENSNRPYAIYATMSAGASAKDMAAPAPEIATGQNQITSDVNVTYEIR